MEKAGIRQGMWDKVRAGRGGSCYLGCLLTVSLL